MRGVWTVQKERKIGVGTFRCRNARDKKVRETRAVRVSSEIALPPPRRQSPDWNTGQMTLLKKLLRLYWKAVTSPLTEEERDEFSTFGM